MVSSLSICQLGIKIPIYWGYVPFQWTQVMKMATANTSSKHHSQYYCFFFCQNNTSNAGLVFAVAILISCIHWNGTYSQWMWILSNTVQISLHAYIFISPSSSSEINNNTCCVDLTHKVVNVLGHRKVLYQHRYFCCVERMYYPDVITV